MANSGSNRRQFLKNISLASLSLGIAPSLAGRAAGNASEETSSCFATTQDYFGEGPFYTANPPVLANGKLAATNEPGTRIIITGRVHNLACTEFLPNTEVDIWHANDAGQYDNQAYNLRGVVKSNAQGFYCLKPLSPESI
ncbi:MAG: hypothetical protein U5L96_10060 [Owenweeksia sp.]|nr:hypothetical protein [Owenweeksia sp.]